MARTTALKVEASTLHSTDCPAKHTVSVSVTRRVKPAWFVHRCQKGFCPDAAWAMHSFFEQVHDSGLSSLKEVMSPREGVGM